MALVPRDTLQSVLPSGGPLRENIPAGAFEGIGQGLAQAAGGVEQVSGVLAQHAEMRATLDAKAASDAAAISADQAQAQAVEHYRTSNLGIAASQNLGQIYKTLEDARADAKGSLASPLAQRLYDEATRMNTVKLQNGLATWAADQKKSYNVAQFKAVSDNALRGATADNLDDIIDKQVKPQYLAIGTELGWSPEQMQSEVAKTVGEAAYGMTVGTAAKHPELAQAMFEKYKGYLTPSQAGVLQSQIQASVDNHSIATIADEAVTRSAGGDGGYLAAIHGREGNGDNPHSTATGVGQFVDKTWLATLKGDARFADVVKGKTDKELLALRSDPAIADQAILSYRDANKVTLSAAGLPVNDATLGMAHGYGPGGAEKILRADPNTPMQDIVGAQTAKNNRVFGKPAGEVIADFNSRFGGRDALDSMESGLPSALAGVASDPRLRGDPILIDRAQQQVLANANRIRNASNIAVGAASDRLWQAAVAGNVTDISKLQQTYPGALGDWNALSAQAQRQLQTKLTTWGNQPTPGRDANFLSVQGGLLSPNTSSTFAHEDLSGLDLTHSQYMKLRTMQQEVIGRSQRVAQQQANVTSALSLEPVKQALAVRPDLRPDTPEYNQFTGALSAKIEQWIEDHPGKKPGEADKAAMAQSLLAARPAHWSVLGVDVPGWKTSVNVPAVPPEEADAIRSQNAARGLPELSDFQIGRIYYNAHRGQ